LQKKKDANAACPFVLKNLQDFRRTMRLPKENGGYQVPTSDYSVHSYLYNVRPSKEHKGCVDLIYPTADHSCEVKKWKTVELLMVQIGDK